VSGFTEALFAMGCGNRVAGVSTYCSRYVPGLTAPVIGDYLRIDRSKLEACRPDLILATGGIQLNLARELADRGLPVYALPLSCSLFGILENVVTLGGLMGEMTAGRRLAVELSAGTARIAAAAGEPRPRVYVECWFGRHVRTIGGQSFIHDLVTIAGGDPIFGGSPEAYPRPDLDAVAAARPDIGLFFWEPDHPVCVTEILGERGWESLFRGRVIEADVRRGRNLIHDGPSFVETAEWLSAELRRCRRSDSR
jgi:ABC-type Fe3+-hydroxamate transport system substrate-binding protein